MPRNTSGTYSLVAGNPVTTGAIIQSDWANTTMPDLANEMTDSLSRSGKGSMTAPLVLIKGSAASPSMTFGSFPQSGLYAESANDIRLAVSGIDRFRWLSANSLPQTWDNDAGIWRDVGGGGIIWQQLDVVPALSEISNGYVTLGGQSTLLPANPPVGFSIAYADKADDWSSTNFLTLDGNGNTFSQDGSSSYELNLKGAFAQFSFIDGQWQIVNFGRLSDAYGYDLDDYYTKPETNALLVNENLLINGGFDVAQRGTSFPFTPPETRKYTVDRWYGEKAVGSVMTVTAQALATDYVDPKYRGKRFLSVSSSVIAAGTINKFATRLEDVKKYAGKTFTASFDANTDIPVGDVRLAANLWFGTGGSPIAFFLDTAIPITAAISRHSLTFTVPAINGETIGEGSYLDIGLITDALGGFNLLDFKLEEGSIATPYQSRPIGEELALCQRYYQTGRTAQSDDSASTGAYTRIFGLPLTPQMRTVPAIYSSTFAYSGGVSIGSATSSTAQDLQISAQWPASGITSKGFVCDYALDAEL